MSHRLQTSRTFSLLSSSLSLSPLSPASSAACLTWCDAAFGLRLPVLRDEQEEEEEEAADGEEVLVPERRCFCGLATPTVA